MRAYPENHATIASILADHPDFVIEDGIPRQRALWSDAQSQTADTFGFKWSRRETFESTPFQTMAGEWLKDRYQFPGRTIADVIRGRRILDAGCGAGHSGILLFGDALRECNYLGVDISTAVEVARARFAELAYPGEFLQASLLELPDVLGKFDVILAEGVLHHTDSTRGAFLNLASRLEFGGHFLAYVYRKKGPIREFVDDEVRHRLAAMSDEEAWKALEPLTLLGKKLGDLDIELEIEQPIDLLEIPAGKMNLQRFFYWHILKAFYRPELSLSEMNHINFDWYRPTNAHRHTVEEVEGWISQAGLNPVAIREEEAGITIIAERSHVSPADSPCGG